MANRSRWLLAVCSDRGEKIERRNRGRNRATNQAAKKTARWGNRAVGRYRGGGQTVSRQRGGCWGYLASVQSPHDSGMTVSRRPRLAARARLLMHKRVLPALAGRICLAISCITYNSLNILNYSRKNRIFSRRSGNTSHGTAIFPTDLSTSFSTAAQHAATCVPPSQHGAAIPASLAAPGPACCTAFPRVTRCICIRISGSITVRPRP